MELVELEQIIDRARLDRLDKLNLRHCGLSTIPESIGNLSDLTSLDLYNNELKVLPASIGNLSKLTNLNLNHNQLTNVPDSICQLSNLTTLILSNNQLTGLPDTITNLSKLTHLGLEYCQLASLPASITQFPSLTHLELNHNQLTSLPASIANLFSLTNMELAHNRLVSLPESFASLHSLAKLDLRANQLTSLPASIGDLSRLTDLNLSDNQLTSLPASIGGLSSLTRLYLNGNQLTNLPASMANLSNLTRLYLDGNPVTDLSVLQNIPDLERVCCLGGHYLPRKYWTHFSQWKPEWLLNEWYVSMGYKLIELLGCEQIIQKLALFNPKLPQEEIHIYPYNPSKIELSFRASNLSLLPESIGKLNYITDLDLSHNQLTSLPESIANLANLTHLNLNNNPWTDLTVIQNIPNLEKISCFDINLPRRYWTKLNEWKPEWLLDENNAETRRALIEQIGYEKICDELNAITLDTWREYTLLKIDEIERFYDRKDEVVGTEPMILLKMTCPSTGHIHILRVPPEIVSAEAAITWVNHGIHPDEFAVQT